MHKFLILFVVFLFSHAYSLKLPDYLKVCHRSDPNLDECITKSVNDLKVHTIAGDNNYGIPSLSSITVEHLLDNKLVGPKKNFKLSIDNLTIDGLSQYDVEHFEAHLNESLFYMIVNVESLHVYGEYKLSGREGFLKVNGSDKVSGYLRNVRSTVTIFYQLVNNDGLEYIDPTDVAVHVSITRGNMVFDNIFPRNRMLTKQAQKKINKHFRTYMNDMTSDMNREIGEILKKIVKNFFSKYTYEQLLPQ